MRTLTPKQSQITQEWYVVDAKGQTLGRMSTEIARILRGKNKPYFSPHLDTGDYVVVINADKVKLSGNKVEQKEYQRYSGYPGGLKKISYKRMVANNPEEIVIHSVKGMLPKNSLGRKLIRKLKVYCGEEHNHHAQKPKVLNLNFNNKEKN